MVFSEMEGKGGFFRYLKGKWKTREERAGRRKQGDLEPEDLHAAPLPLPQHFLHSLIGEFTTPAIIVAFLFKCLRNEAVPQ